MVYEVTGQLRVSASVPWLAAVLALLRQSLELSQDLLDKVCLNGCCLSLPSCLSLQVKVFDGVSSV